MNKSVRALVLAGLAAVLLAVPLAAPANAGSTCKRTVHGISCTVSYKAWPSSWGTFTFGVNNRSGEVRASAGAGSVWLDGTNDTSGRTWVGPLGKVQPNRFRFQLWRACAPDYRPGVRYACTGWAWQGPR